MTIYRLEIRGEFPQRKQLSPNSVGWLESEIDEWIASRRSAKSDIETTAVGDPRKCVTSSGSNICSFRPHRTNLPHPRKRIPS